MNKKLSTPVFILFFISGFSALIYQIAWQRSLFTLLGSNIESTTIIVTVFMLGLGFGALTGGWLSRIFSGRILAVFAGLEAVIGIYGFCSILIINCIAAININGQAATILLAMAVLLLPTMMMGASLPLLTKHINNVYVNAGRSVAALYLYNTLGAAFAALLTVLVLFEVLGLKGTVYSAGALNILVGICAFVVYWRSK